MPVIAVLLGGLVGTSARLGLDAMLPHADDGFPFSTLAINVAGAFVLAVLVARVWTSAPEWLRAGLGAGVLGSFTTFSAVAVSLVSLADSGAWGLAGLYAAVTIGAGLAAAWLGLALGRRRRPLALEASE